MTSGRSVPDQREGVAPLPPGACDSHLHVFGAAEDYPSIPSPLYRPPRTEIADYRRRADELGIERFVLVQPSVYGTDNRCLLDALAALGPRRGRGVVAVPDGGPAEATLDTWRRLGVRGIRLETHERVADAAVVASWRARVAGAAEVAGPRGWHLDFLTPGWLTSALLPTLADLSVDFTLAHAGLFSAADGVGQPGFQGLLDLIGHTDRCWVKLTAPYRQSRLPGWSDVRPFYEALIAARADRLVWGSDFPHVYVEAPVDTDDVVRQLLRWVLDPDVRRQILVTNPAVLYGFETPTGAGCG